MLFVFVLSNTLSQTTKDTVYYFPNTFLINTKQFFLEKKDENECLNIIKSVTITGLSFTIDKKVKKFSQDQKFRSPFLNNLTKIDKYFGTGKSAIIVSGGTLLIGLVTNDDNITNAGIMLTESLFFSNIITQSLKMILGRERPNETDNNFHFIGPNLRYDKFQALPSGHSTTAFAICTVVAGLTDNCYLKALCYSPAIITSFARIYNNRHWLSDVILSSLIGYYTGQKVLSIHQKTEYVNNLDINIGYRSVVIKLNF